MGIRDRTYGATTDNAQNAIDDITELYHLDCIVHALQFSFNKLFYLTLAAQLLGRVKKWLKHFKRSTKEIYVLHNV